jgi:hypothetical protein
MAGHTSHVRTARASSRGSCSCGRVAAFRGTRPVLLLVALVLTVLPAPAAEAQAVGKRCRDVEAGGKRATHVFADFMPCRSRRAKLRRWLPRNALPRNRQGWYCYRLGGRVLTCSYPGPRNAQRAFTFWLRRVARAATEAANWKRCGSWDGTGKWGYKPPGFGYFNVRALNVSCRSARRIVQAHRNWEYEPTGRRTGRQRGEGRWSDWTCYHRQVGYEATRTRCRASGGRRVKWLSAA